MNNNLIQIVTVLAITMAMVSCGKKTITTRPQRKNITELVLAMAALGKKITAPQIKKAMQEVKVRDIYKWKQENTSESLAKNKRDFFSKNELK